MKAIAMDDISVKLGQIAAGLQTILEGMDGDFGAVQGSGADAKAISLCACRRGAAVYLPALQLILDSVSALEAQAEAGAEAEVRG